MNDADALMEFSMMELITMEKFSRGCYLMAPFQVGNDSKLILIIFSLRIYSFAKLVND